MSNIFIVDFDKWIATMLPTFLRRKKLFAFIRGLCATLYQGDESLYERFGDARADHIFRLSHNGQVCYLRHALNSSFGLTKGFEIEDPAEDPGEWLYAKQEDMEGQLLTVDETTNANLAEGAAEPEHSVPLLADEAQLMAAHNTFIVRVPQDIYYSQLDKVKSIVEQFRLLSKQPIYTPIKNEYGTIQPGVVITRWEWPVPLVNTRSGLLAGAGTSAASTLKDSR